MIPARLQKPLLAVAALVILYCLFSASRLFRQPPPQVTYDTGQVDEAVAWVAAQEAGRITPPPNAVLLFLAHEDAKGSEWERAASAYAKGFEAGLKETSGNSPSSLTILAKKYKGDDPALGGSYPPVPLAGIQSIAAEQPRCNLIVAFGGFPQVDVSQRGTYHPSQLPHFIVILNSPSDTGFWRQMFDTGLVDVLVIKRAHPVGQPDQDMRNLVESHYWVITKSNLDEAMRQAVGQ